MKKEIVHEKCPIALLGGGKVKKTLLKKVLEVAPIVVAADGGAAHAIAHGVIPNAVIGDFDSIDQDIVARIPKDRLFPIKEQDSTDFEKCLRNISAPLVIGVGFTAGRQDHYLAALHGLVRYGARPCILLGAKDLVFVAPAEFEITLPVGCRFSLFPMGPVRAVSRGLRWPIDGIAFAPETKIGTSNEVVAPNEGATGGPMGGDVRVYIKVDAPNMLVILPTRHLKAAMAAFLD